MRLVMIPYAVDSNEVPLAFVPKWIAALARRVEYLHVVTPWEGEHEPFPGNVSVHSLRKDQGLSKMQRLRRLYAILWKLVRREGIDACFVHMHTAMTPIVWPLLRLYNIPVISWYAHGHVDRTIPLTHALSRAIVSSSPAAYRYRSDAKVHFIGQGIDETAFFPTKNVPRQGILSLGRLSPMKNVETLLEAVALLRDAGTPMPCRIVGNTPQEHIGYLARLKDRARGLRLGDLVEFLPPVTNTQAPRLYNSAHIHVNCAPASHSMDKTILEAAFCGVPSLTSVRALEQTYTDLSTTLLFREKDPEDLMSKLRAVPPYGSREYTQLGEKMRARAERHSLSSFADRLVAILQNARSSQRDSR